VTDFNAVERGSKIIAQFTIPKLTTEGLPVDFPPDVELRIGPLPAGKFEFPVWEQHSDRIERVDTRAAIARAEFDASSYYGKTEVVGVQVHGPHGRSVGWSNLVTLEVVPALPTPTALEAKDAPDAIRLEWRADAPEFRIFRKLPDDPDWVMIGTGDKPFYVDGTIDYGKTYQYLVQAIRKAGASYAESDLSETISFQPVDKFPPAVPTGVTPVPGTRSIELVWDRNAEKDFAQYRVFRDGRKVAEGLTAPSYSDRDAKPGTRYRYRISAVDTAGNASALSTAVEAVIP
jgi:hypothetical protein